MLGAVIMRMLVALLTAVAMTSGVTSGVVASAVAEDVPQHRLTVRGSAFVDEYGREVVLRGFNVSGEEKVAEKRFLPFANAADARRSAQSMRALTGANAVRFPIAWAGTQPVRGP